MKTWRSWRAHYTKRYDVLVVLGITLLVFSLSGFFNMYEWFTTRTRYLERWQIDEMPVALLAFSLGCVWLLQRRARELAAAMTRRQQMASALQDNLLEIARDHSWVKVHTRHMRKDGGAWEGWAVWPGTSPHEKRTYYTTDFSDT